MFRHNLLVKVQPCSIWHNLRGNGDVAGIRHNLAVMVQGIRHDVMVVVQTGIRDNLVIMDLAVMAKEFKIRTEWLTWLQKS